ncbi:MAG TPA: M15 family metallopeptidase [Candidatus Limnocylindrales bacterium]|nr:M15 family metallopeptidase [Candidatus Limnocylindrales bacterium]
MRRAWPLRALLTAVILGAGLLAVPASDPPVANGVGPLPDCRLDDILTEPRGYDDWATTQVDWILGVGKDYKPPDRVSIFNAGVTGGGQVRRVAFDDLKAMATAARKAGVPLGSVSAYRSYRQQVELFGQYVDDYGFKKAVTFSARPGHSEHQLGLVIDFAAAGKSSFVNESTPTGRWLAKNAWKYGWLMSYPDGKEKVVCYSYEPWHYRYVGRDLAEKIHDSGLTIREYLWTNYTQVDPACVGLPAPKLVTPGKPRSCALPEPSPAASPLASPGGTAGPGGATPIPVGSAAAPGSPQSTPQPEPASALGQALPIGVALVVAVVVMLGFVLWRSSRRAARYRS